MKRLPVRYSDVALEDLDAILDGTLQTSGSVASTSRFINGIRQRCEDIGELPYGGVHRDALLPGVRIVTYRKKAIIAYIVTDEAVVITNVFVRGDDYQAVLMGDRPRRR